MGDPTKTTIVHPKHPERVCWGCEKLCPADSLACGNGTIRAPHPVELFGDDWLEWLTDRRSSSNHVGDHPGEGGGPGR
jgi:hypothetical protein